MIGNNKCVVSDIQQMKWEMRFGGSPLHSDKEGFGAPCTWNTVGREGGVAQGFGGGRGGVGWRGGGYTAHSVNPAHKSSLGDQRGEARSNTSEEQPQGGKISLRD